MQFGLSEEQVLLQDNVNRFLTDNVPLERVRKYAEEGSDQEIWQGLVELGIPALLIPEEQGGLGMTPMDAAIVAESLGYHVAPTPFLGSAIMGPVALSRSTQDYSELLGQIIEGKTRIGIAFGESVGNRNDARVTVESGKMNGKSIFAFDLEANHYLVADKSKNLYLVDAQATGLEKKELVTVDKTRKTVELTYNGVEALLLTSDSTIYDETLDVGRVMLAADTLGAAQNMIDQSVAYAMQREQFNRVIASFQAVKHMCAQMAADLEPCRSMVWFASHALSELPDESRITACHTKAHLAEVGKSVSKTATEVHGGMGFTDLLGLHYWFKRIGANRQWLGAPELIREEAANIEGLTG